MNEENREHLSALIDDELSPSRAQRLLDAMRQDGELRQFWQSGHLISAAMHGETMAMGDKAKEIIGLADRVRDALETEPAILAPPPDTRNRSLGLMGGLALAASVAIIAIIATQQALLDRQTSTPQTVAGTAPQAPAVSANTTQLTRLNDLSSPVFPVSSGSQRQQDESRSTALTRMTWNDAAPGVEARLNAYLLNHNEFTVGGVRGMLPYARIVGYGPTQ